MTFGQSTILLYSSFRTSVQPFASGNLASRTAATSSSFDPHSQILDDLGHGPLHNLVQTLNTKSDCRLVHLNMVFQQSQLLLRRALGVWYATQVRIVGPVHVVQKQLHDEGVFVVELNDTRLSWLVEVSICYGFNKRTASREEAEEYRPSD